MQILDVQNWPVSFQQMWQKFYRKIVKLNLFDTESNDMNTIFRERASTWVYILLVSIFLSIFSLYMIADTNFTVDRLSVSTFEEYQNFHSSQRDIRCPCSQITVPYRNAITINASFHQICASDYVRDPWFDFLFDDGIWFPYYRADLRIRGAAYFALLDSLCNLSRTVIENSIEQLMNEKFSNSYLISEHDFESKAQAIVDTFTTQTSLGFTSAIELINSVTHANTFVSTYFLNWDWSAPRTRSFEQVSARPVVLDNDCSCGTRNDCRTLGGAFTLFGNRSYFPMPGVFIGCSSVSTLLGSTLECFYDQNCVNDLIDALTTGYGLSGSIFVSALDPNKGRRFSSTAPITDLVGALMVEEWHTSISYPSFYNVCDPKYCTYVDEKHNDVLTIITRILSFYGGLTTVLRLIVPSLIKLILKIRNRRRTTPISNFM